MQLQTKRIIVTACLFRALVGLSHQTPSARRETEVDTVLFIAAIQLEAVQFINEMLCDVPSHKKKPEKLRVINIH